MGFDEGRMVLDSPNGAYYSGQTVHGRLIFQQDSVKTFRGIYVKFKGFCKVHWTTTEYHTVNGKRQSHTVHHDSYEEYANTKVYLVGGESGDHQLQPGSYDYPFSFHLPAGCPSSFEGSVGHVRYEIKAVVDRAFKFDQEKKVAVRVMCPLDLNAIPSCREPIEMEFNASYCCCCMRSGATDTVINIPVSGFCPGQTMPIEVACNNKGGVEINCIKLIISKKITFTATSRPGVRASKDTVAEIKKGPIPADTTRNYSVELAIPALDVYNLTGCRYIDIDYKFKAIVSPSGCHSDSEGSRMIVIGNIPLVGFQDNVQNPLQDQMPQQIAVVTQQPLLNTSNPPYPTVEPYPVPTSYQAGDSKPPYPTVNSSFSDNPPPYPGNTPYPTEMSPYPGSNAPYPTEKSPYPGSNAPYPTEKSPYTGGSAPYPTGTTANPISSPYPTGNAPYPTGNRANPITSYPTDNAPYPTGNTSNSITSPYPTGNAPYPTGNTANPASSPYPTGNAPYPIRNTASSPYHTGNAPYPTGNTASSPYPTGNAPYPTGNTGSSPYPTGNAPYPTAASPYPPSSTTIPGMGSNTGGLLRTGNIGFITGSASPNPISPVPVNPYETASAPTLNSPDAKM